MEQILNELKEIKKILEIHGRMIETLVEQMDQLFHVKNNNTTVVKDQMNMVKNLFQSTPGLEDNPIIQQLFSQFDDALKESTNDR
jgi:hypothetical protein